MALVRHLFCFSFVLALISCDELFNDGIMSHVAVLPPEHQANDPHCLNHIHKFYRQLKCQPKVSPNSKCPTSYNCPNLLERSSDHCYYDGNHYPVGYNLTAKFHPPCTYTCQCVGDHGEVRFKCKEKKDGKECKSAPGCKNFGFIDDFQCCERQVTSCNQGKEIKCLYDGETYSEGEIFFPTEDITGVQCVCTADFNGTIAEPYCQKLSCVIELWGENPEKLASTCIPVYVTQDGSCPVSYRCPKSTDRLVKPKNPSSSMETDKTCQFGNLTMNVGDKLSPWIDAKGKDKSAVCSCEVPPLASCVVEKFFNDYHIKKLARKDLYWTTS